MLDVAANSEESAQHGAATPLRIGVIRARNDDFQNWELRLFDQIEADPRFALSFFLFKRRQRGQRLASPLFSIISGHERMVLAREPPYHCKWFKAGNQHFEHLAEIVERDGEEACEAGRQMGLLDVDIVLNLTPQGLPSKVVRSLQYGELMFSFSKETKGMAEWSSYAAIIEKRPSVTLQLYARRGDPCETACVASSSFNVKFSAARTAGFVRERAVTLLIRELNRLVDAGRIDTLPSGNEREQVARPPSDGELVRYAFELLTKSAVRAGNALMRKLGSGSAVWTLFTGSGDIENFDPREAVEIVPDKDNIRADPFLLEHQGAQYLFYETYAQGGQRAQIGVGRLDGNRLEKLGIALDCEYHLSYPFVFEHGGDVFMMPETNQARRLEIWRCVDFPLKWERYSTAFEGMSLADSTLTKYKGRWWLFTNLSHFHAYEDHCSELHIFEVDGPSLRKIVPHRRNPVVIDSTLARNAGRMFERNGRLFRPSQHNAYGIYGYGLNIMEIDELDLDHYKEHCVRTIIPNFKPGIIGCHHFDAAGGRYIIDARLGRRGATNLNN